MRAVLAILVLTTAVACTSAPERAATDPIEVFGPYRGVDGERFNGVLDEIEATTGFPIEYIGSSSYAPTLQRRVAEGAAPDIAIVPQPAFVEELAEDGHLRPLADEVVERLDAAFVGELRELGRVGGSDYGVWFRAVINSLVWFHGPTFAERGYDVPASWSELSALSERMVEDGLVPWCVGINAYASTGWMATDWFEDVLLRFGGPERYDELVAGSASFLDDDVVGALDVIGSLLLEGGRVLGGRRGILTTRVEDAILPMLRAEPACLMHRSGIDTAPLLPEPATLTDGPVPESTYGVFVLPPTTADDTAPLLVAGEQAVAFSDRPGVQEVLARLAEPATMESWVGSGGALSPQLGFDRSLYPTELAAALSERWHDRPDNVRFDLSDQMPSPVSLEMWRAMAAFLGGEIDAITTMARIQVVRDELAELDDSSPGAVIAGG